VPCLVRTGETLQNLTLELATMGDLKLVERLQQYTLAPGASKVIRANIKVGRAAAMLAGCMGCSKSRVCVPRTECVREG
jgi:vesicle coat complex subunit